MALKVQRKKLFDKEKSDEEEEKVIKELKGCTSLFISKIFHYHAYYYEESDEAAAIEPFWEVHYLKFDDNHNIKNVFIGIGMEFIGGRNLADKDLNIADSALLFKYIIQVAAGLEWLHNKNIMHRDIKPENIIITKDLSKVNFVLT